MFATGEGFAMRKAKITASAPILLVKDIPKSAAYFHDQLGFTEQKMYGEPPYFAMVRRDGFAVMLAQLGDDRADIPYWKIVDKMWNIYFWVDDVAAIYAEYQASGAIIDYTLYTTPYGVKEFGVQDLDDHDIAFGQVIGSS
jgi:catechol 2,3-dioxygenase-like lactoylglutathione lyase family enzyme